LHLTRPVNVFKRSFGWPQPTNFLPRTAFRLRGFFLRRQAKGLAIAAGTAVVAALMFAAIEAGLIERRPFNAEVTAGIALGIPAVYVLTKIRFHRIDEFLGDISYGVFLNHFVVMYFLRAFWPVAYDAHIVAAVLVLSFGLSCVSYYYIERPALKLRHALRGGARYGVGKAQGGETAV
jgi:peptidoglycan/LPS O-acetylase OafA/YrhL